MIRLAEMHKCRNRNCLRLAEGRGQECTHCWIDRVLHREHARHALDRVNKRVTRG